MPEYHPVRGCGTYIKIESEHPLPNAAGKSGAKATAERIEDIIGLAGLCGCRVYAGDTELDADSARVVIRDVEQHRKEGVM